jgi:hypothetical protein
MQHINGKILVKTKKSMQQLGAPASEKGMFHSHRNVVCSCIIVRPTLDLQSLLNQHSIHLSED